MSSGKVLVTGANGFIAAVSRGLVMSPPQLTAIIQWVVRSLLEEGFSVRGTVRSEAKGAHLRRQFASYGDRLELVIVPDIIKVGRRAIDRIAFQSLDMPH